MIFPQHIRSLVFLVFVCSLSAEAKAMDDTLRVQLKWWHQFQFAGYYAADIKGYYKKENLLVRLIPGDIEHSPINEVLSGRAQFGISGSDLLIHFAQGKPIVALGAVFQHSPYVILSPTNRNIHVPSDLIRKTIMVSENQGWVEVSAMFIKEGIPLDSVKIVTHSWKNTDLVNGRADAMTAYESVEPYQLQRLGVEVNMMRPEDYGIDFYGDVLFSLKQMADKDAITTENFRKASFEGWEYAMSHVDEMADYILTLPGVKERGVTKELLKAEAEGMRKLILPDVIELGHMNKGRWQNILSIHEGLGLISKGIQLDGFLYEGPKNVSWRYLRTGIIVIAVILVVLLSIIVYSMSLRKAVRKRTAELDMEIRQRTMAQQLLQWSEERLEMATHAAGLGIWDWDLVKNTVYFNDLWKTMLGYAPHDLGNNFETFTRLLHPEDKEDLMKLLYDHINGKNPMFQTVTRLRTKDRRWKWVLTMSKASHRNAEGIATRLSGVHLDINDIKNKELELRELSQELMNSNRELQQFAYITSHNLRAPVANLLSLVRLFDRGELTERNEIFLQKMNLCIDKLHGTLDDLNEILSSRVHKSDTLETLSCETLLKDVLASISEEIKAQQAVITHDFSKVNRIRYSKKVMNSILINLITNAIKYRKPSEPPLIHLATEEDGEFVILSVKDNGVGMDIEQHGKKIFGLYQRFHANTEGKGLGLYIIKNQIESLEGKIAVDSIEGMGTIFYVFMKK